LKSIGEILVASLCPNYAVARIAGVYGIHWSYPDHVQKEAGIGVGWLANYFVDRLCRNEPVAVWTDHLNILSNPSLASDVADALLTIAEQDHTGILHCCGRDSVSRLELAMAVAEVFNYDAHLIRAASAEEMDLKTLEGKLPAARDSRLNVAHSESRLNRKNLGVYEGLREFKRQREQLA
jgi:dTDP-4-dehydrorhamnose reductase